MNTPEEIDEMVRRSKISAARNLCQMTNMDRMFADSIIDDVVNAAVLTISAAQLRVMNEAKKGETISEQP